MVWRRWRWWGWAHIRYGAGASDKPGFFTQRREGGKAQRAKWKPAMITDKEVWEALEDVKDPEIPMVSVVELGIVQNVLVEGETVQVTITPTFTGCPALHVMREDIVTRVRGLGVAEVEVTVALSPR